jgi:F-box protein 9
VHEDYKKKHFPPSAFAKPKAPPTAAHSSKTVGAAQNTTVENPTPSLPATLKQLVDDFSLLQIEPAPPETDYSPQKPCHLAEIPEEILSHILLELAIIDVASFVRMAQVCKRLAYLVLTEESIWKAVTLSEEYGFPAMHYNYATTIEGRPLEDDYEDLRPYQEDDSDSPSNTNLSLQTLKSLSYTQSLIPNPYPSWRQMFRTRPRLRFNGCYISTVNYARPGAHASNSLAWGAPVLVVTYFRYLRFFRDGTAISLLSTTEPADVVHHLTKANLDLYDSSRKTRGHHHHNQGSTATSALPGAVMKEALRGRWRLSGPLHPSSSSPNTKIPSSSSPSPADPNEATELPSEAIEEPAEEEGTVHIETQGVVPRYTYKLALALGHAGKSARNNKLAWKGFWSYNRLSDDWGEFSLRNDRAFYWSRVRSYDGWE